jgi:hypothetical protein
LGALLLVIGTGVVGGRRVRKITSHESTADLAQALVASTAAVALGGFGLNIIRFPMTAGVLFLSVGSVGALLRLERAAAPPPAAVFARERGDLEPAPAGGVM